MSTGVRGGMVTYPDCEANRGASGIGGRWVGPKARAFFAEARLEITIVQADGVKALRLQ